MFFCVCVPRLSALCRLTHLMLVYYSCWLATHTFSYLVVKKTDPVPCVKKATGNLKPMKSVARYSTQHKTAALRSTSQLMKMKSCFEDWKNKTLKDTTFSHVFSPTWLKASIGRRLSNFIYPTSRNAYCMQLGYFRAFYFSVKCTLLGQIPNEEQNRLECKAKLLHPTKLLQTHGCRR